MRYYVTKAGLGRVTVAMSREDADLYIAGAEANGGTGYTVHREIPAPHGDACGCVVCTEATGMLVAVDR